MSTHQTTLYHRRLVRHQDFPSRYVEGRNIDIWLPPSPEAGDKTRDQVLYIQDGQNAFDRGTATGGVDWGIGATLDALTAAGRIQPTIAVAIWNAPRRDEEYLPKLGRSLGSGAVAAENPIADAYLRFWIEELMPFINATYRATPADGPRCFAIGSSRGALVSLYAVCQHPRLFRGAACLSTHWTVSMGVLPEYFASVFPPPGRHRFYYDYGSRGLDSRYPPHQKRVDEHMIAHGYRHGVDWLTRFFPGAGHAEEAWRARVAIPLAFLLAS